MQYQDWRVGLVFLCSERKKNNSPRMAPRCRNM